MLAALLSFPAGDDALKFAKKDEESKKKSVRGDVLQCSSSSSPNWCFAIYLSSSIVMMMAKPRDD